MKIVVKDRRLSPSGRTKPKYDIDYGVIRRNIPLTQKVLRHYKVTKSPVGYATFRGLGLRDIKSILSAVKRQEARINVERYGMVAYYKLLSRGNK